MSIAAAMNEAPVKLIQQERDFFYRLSVGMLTLPPLRARPEDIPHWRIILLINTVMTVPQDIHGPSETAR